MSEKSPIVQVRLSEKLLKKIDDLIFEANKSAGARPWTRSSWIRHAIDMQLTVAAEREKVRSPRRYKCKTCGKKKYIHEIAYQLTDLHGEREFYCSDCHPNHPNV